MAYEMTFQRSQKGSGIYPYNREVVIDYDRLQLPTDTQTAPEPSTPLLPSASPPAASASTAPAPVTPAPVTPAPVTPAPITAAPLTLAIAAGEKPAEEPVARNELSVASRKNIPTVVLWFLLGLRFLNLLEPGRYVISISKTWMWVTLAMVIYVLMYDAENAAAVIGAAAGAAGSMGNYAWRRYMQHVTGTVPAIDLPGKKRAILKPKTPHKAQRS